MDFLYKSKSRLQKDLLPEGTGSKKRALEVIGFDGKTLKGLTEYAGECYVRSLLRNRWMQ